MNSPRRSLAAALVLLASLATSAIAQEASEEVQTAVPEPLSVPRFEPTPCWVDAAAELGGEGIECGYLVVPERRDRSDSRLLRLAVAILPSRAEEPLPDPVLYLHGGPGGYAVASPSSWLESPLRDERRLILLDQRGAGLSEPSLCPDLGLHDFRVMAGDHLPGDEIEGRKAVALRCRDALLEQGIDLGAWNSTTSAQDIGDLRRVLDIEEWNLFGVSYGTRLALAVMRATGGEGLRSVILDSTYPPWAPAWDTKTPDFARALHEFFTACEEDEACAEAFPDLRRRTREGLAELEKRPLRSEVDNAEVLPDGLLVSNAQDGAIAIHQLLYASHTYAGLPVLLDAMEKRERGLARNLADLMTLRALSLSRATNLIVECYERAPFQDRARQARYGKADPLLHRLHTYFDADYDICSEWSDRAATAREVRPVRVDVPTLVFGGRYDPITPPDWGERTSRTLPDARFIEFPVGHGAYRTHECPREIASAFVEDPTATLDDSCIARMEPIEFVTRWRSSPDAWLLVRSMIVKPQARVVGPVAGGIGLLGLGLLVLPLGGVLRRARGVTAPVVPPARGWVLGTALLALTFWLSLLGVIAWTADSNPLLVLVGLPFWSHALFWLPQLGLAVGAAAAVLLWRDRGIGPRSARLLDAGIVGVACLLLLLRFAWEL